MVLEERVSRLEGAYEQVDRRLSDLNTSMEALRTDLIGRIGETDGRIEALHAEMNSGISALRTDMEKRFNTLYMVVGSTSVAILIAMIGILVTAIQRL